MSTQLIQSKALEALKQSVHPGLRRLAVEETESALVVSGQVPSYFLKQMAQETLKPFSGRRQLVNQVTVGQ